VWEGVGEGWEVCGGAGGLNGGKKERWGWERWRKRRGGWGEEMVGEVVEESGAR